MRWELIVAGVALAAVVAVITLSLVRSAWVVTVSNATMVIQVGLVVVAWLLMATMPETRNWNGGVGDTCPDLDTAQGVALGVLAVGSLAIGAVAALAGTVSVVRRAASPGRLVAGLATAGLCLFIWVPLIGQAFCGFN